jgi:hypothetical protein
MSINHCQSWLNSAFEEDDLTVVLKDERGNYKRIKIEFYETYPELEKEAKLFAVQHATKSGITSHKIDIIVDNARTHFT